MKKYRSSDLIFGFRDNYLELKKKLDLLGDLTDVVKGKNFKKISYRVVPNSNYSEIQNGIDKKFWCDLINNRSILDEVISYIKFGYTFFPTTGIRGLDLEKDNNGDYIIKDKYFNNIISITDQDRFKETIEEIKDLDFFKNMAFERLCPDKKNPGNYILLGCGGIILKRRIHDDMGGGVLLLSLVKFNYLSCL